MTGDKSRSKALGLAATTHGRHCVHCHCRSGACSGSANRVCTMYCPVSPSSCAAGVQPVAIEGRERNHLVVVGDGLDAVSLTSYLRKKVGGAQIVQVEVVAEAAPPTRRSRRRPPPSPRARSTSGNRATAATTTPGRPLRTRTRTPASTGTATTTTPTPTPQPRRAPSCDRSAGNRGALLNDNCREILMWLVLVDKARTDSNLSIFNQ